MKTNLNNKIWYRAIKVLFIIFFITAQFFGIIFVLNITSGQKITDESFERVGKEIKEIYPEYNYLSDRGLGETIYTERLDVWIDYLTIREYLNKEEVVEIINKRPENTTRESMLSVLSDRLLKGISGREKKYESLRERERKIPTSKTILYCIAYFILVSIFLWLMARIFFYIVLGKGLFECKSK